MMPPISVTATMLRRCVRCRGDSRTISTRRRRSLRATSAARVSRLSASPCAMAASVRMEQGATTMAWHWNEPLAMAAPTLATSCTRWARASTAGRSMSSSCCRLRQPASEATRWVSMPLWPCSTCSRRAPYTAPLAPEIATMMRRVWAASAMRGLHGGRTNQGLRLLIGLHLLQHQRGLHGVKVFVRVLFHAVLLQLVVPVGHDAVARQRAFHADQRTAVERDDGPARAHGLHQVRHVAAHPRDARHLGHAAPVELQRHVVGQLRGAGAAGAGIDRDG